MATKRALSAGLAAIVFATVFAATASAQGTPPPVKKVVAAAAKAKPKAAAKPAAKTATAKPATAKPAAKSKPAKAAAAKPAPGGPLAVEVGKTLQPAPTLEATARRLREAAAARDVEGVAALVADDITVVSAGLDLGSGRSMQKFGPQETSEAIVRFLGANAGGGGDVPPGASAKDRDRILFDRAFTLIVTSIDEAEWGRDPLVTGGFCTYTGTRWNAAAVKTQARGAAVAGGLVDKPTPARATADPKARVVETLQPGRIHLLADGAAAAEGWKAVRLTKGGIGWVTAAALSTPNRSGICFLPTAEGGWLMSAISSVGP